MGYECQNFAVDASPASATFVCRVSLGERFSLADTTGFCATAVFKTVVWWSVSA